MSVQTCPKCSALITPQLERCRRCGTYLHGTRAAGWFVASLPGPLRGAPTSGAIALAIVVGYLATVVLALPASPLGFSAYTLRHVGATFGPAILLGEWWRLVTSFWLHHDVVHLAFNLYALAIVGPVVEKLFDGKKAALIYLLSGAASMGVSHLWYLATGNLLVTSGGASGAVCGLIGAAWVGARRYSPRQPHIAQAMGRWAVMLAIFGFLVPGINNAAHGGGLLVGAAMAALVPTGLTSTVGRNRALSLLVTGLALGVLACFALALSHARGYSGSLERDFHGGSIMGMQLGDRPTWDYSAQVEIDRACNRAVSADVPIDDKVRACELAVRVNGHHAPSYHLLAALEQARGNAERAARLERVAARLEEIRER